MAGLKKHGTAVSGAFICVLLLLLVNQQIEATRSLKLEVSVLRGQVDFLQKDLRAVRIELSALNAQTKSNSEYIGRSIGYEAKRAEAVCRSFPQTPGCKELRSISDGTFNWKASMQEYLRTPHP